MSSFTSNTTLYDLLSAVLPGYLVLLWLQLSFPTILPFCIFNAYSNLTMAVVIFVLSYIVGLAFKVLIEAAVNPIFRNRTSTIYSALRVAEVPESFVRDIRKLLEAEPNIDDKSGKRNNTERTIYYAKYYNALKVRPNSPIPIMESQVAFLRSMIAICLIYILSSYWISAFAFVSTFSLVAVLIILETIMVFLAIHIQKKVYRIVWEDAYFFELQLKNTQKSDYNAK